MELTGSVLKKVAVVVVALLVVVGGAAGYVAMTFENPQVQSVEANWGEVTEEETTIRTSVVVNNPNSMGVPGVIDLGYTVYLNDVELAEGGQQGVGLSPGTNEIQMDARMENQAIAEWWVSHVNNGESSTLDIDATVSAPGGISRTLDVRESTIETDMLGPLQSSQQRTITLQGEEFLVLKEQSAAWGEATAEETPVQFSATLENRHNYGLQLDGLGYEIRMNDVTVGEGRTTDGVSIAPGETGTISVDAAIDTPKMADWWATHVRNGETTNMTVAMYGLVEQDGELRRVPLELFQQTLRFETDMLGGGGTQVQPVEGDGGGPSYEQPSLESTEQRLGEVTQSETTIVTTATVDNPNEGPVNDFVSVEAEQQLSFNEVTVVNGSEDLGTLDPGTNELEARFEMDNTKTPQWWARHVNNGEQTTISQQSSTTADLGFTKFDVRSSEETTTLETDLIGAMESSQSQPVEISGTQVGTIEQTSAEWGEADTETSPFTVDVTFSNEIRTDLEIRDVSYTITMNDVVVGEGSAPEPPYTIASGQTRTVPMTFVIDSQKMGEWWVSHLRNGETTTFDVTVEVTVAAAGQTETTQIDSLSPSSTIETSLLNGS